jgi:hypothetical protein
MVGWARGTAVGLRPWTVADWRRVASPVPERRRVAWPDKEERDGDERKRVEESGPEGIRQLWWPLTHVEGHV